MKRSLARPVLVLVVLVSGCAPSTEATVDPDDSERAESTAGELEMLRILVETANGDPQRTADAERELQAFLTEHPQHPEALQLLEQLRSSPAATDQYGNVDAKGVKGQVTRRVDALRYCYEQALRRDPQLQGKIVYTLSIGTSGAVTDVYIEDDSLGDDSVTACTKAKIMGWRFGGQEAPGQVTFPVVFSGG